MFYSKSIPSFVPTHFTILHRLQKFQCDRAEIHLCYEADQESSNDQDQMMVCPYRGDFRIELRVWLKCHRCRWKEGGSRRERSAIVSDFGTKTVLEMDL